MISAKLFVAFSVMLLVTFVLTSNISSVSAAKPHFSGIPTISKNSDLTLTAKFKAVSLGKKEANVYLSSISNMQLGCVNPGGNSPPSKKVDFK
jgi:hypothetical protein